MLIVLGGLLGSGRVILADKLAIIFGLYHYDIDRKKLRRPVLDGQGNFRVLHPKTDKERLRVYKDALEEFPMLSKLYPDVVVDDEFHREVPREYFLSEARKYYESIVFVWIESDEISVRERLGHMQKLGMVRSIVGALRSRERAYAIFQPPAPAVPRFFFTTSGYKQGRALWKLIQQHTRP